MVKKTDIPKQIYLQEKDRPRQWYNIRAEFPDIAPYLTADNKEVAPNDLAMICATELAEHELSFKRYIDIPKEVDDIYKIFRATPLHRAYRLEQMLGTPARMYYKYEGANPSGSHKLNTAIAQAYYNKAQGTKKLVTETGAGQWGTALAIACNMFDLECEVFMVKASAQQKKERKKLIQAFGATVHESPSSFTKSGREILERDPGNLGSLGTAISEAVEVSLSHKGVKYALGSVMNHVAMHQTIIGLECQKQFELIDEYPDIVVACCGGGSNFAGISFPFVADKMKDGREIDIIGVEPIACPTITRGRYAYDFGDIAHFTPKMLQYTLGNQFMPPSIHAGGLRYHGMGSLVSRVMHDKLARAVALNQKDVFKASLEFTKAESILPAPESGHAIAEAINQALICKEKNQEKVILFNVTGHGQFDTKAYDDYFANRLPNINYTDEMLESGFKSIPKN